MAMISSALKLILGLSLLTTSTVAFAADDALTAKINEQVKMIDAKFREQWAVQDSQSLYDLSEPEQKSMKDTLINLCKQNIARRVMNDPSLQGEKFPIDFITKIPLGSVSRDVTAGNEKYTELSHKTQQYHVVAQVRFSDCQVVCDKKNLKLDGQVRNISGKCIGKPVAVLDGDPTVTLLRDIYEFNGISGWQP